jgi:hypothetical protein
MAEPPARRWEPYGFVGESMIDDAWFTDWRGRRFVCPRRPHLRILEGVLAIHRSTAASGRSVIISEDVARQADHELRTLRRSQPGIRSYILTSAWHVPLRWFVLFAGDDRTVDTGGEPPRVFYRTGLTEGIERLERAESLLVDSDAPEQVLSDLTDLAMWLGEFPADSMIELDYGRVAELFSAADLVLDESAAEVWAAIDAFAAGDMERAAEFYGLVMNRWAMAYAVTFSN